MIECDGYFSTGYGEDRLLFNKRYTVWAISMLEMMTIVSTSAGIKFLMVTNT